MDVLFFSSSFVFILLLLFVFNLLGLFLTTFTVFFLLSVIVSVHLMPPLTHSQVVCLFLPLFLLMSVPPWQFRRISPQHWGFLAALLQPGCVTPSACNWHFSGYPGAGRRCWVQRRNSSLAVTQSWSILPLISVMPLRLTIWLRTSCAMVSAGVRLMKGMNCLEAVFLWI